MNASTRGRAGIWLIGARGAISTCVAYGLAGLAEGLIEPVGLCTETEPLVGLGMRHFEDFALGGHDVCTRDLSRSAAELLADRVLSADLVEATSDRAARYEANIRPGILDGPDVGLSDLDPAASEIGASSPRDQIARIQSDLAEFAAGNELERVIVVNLSSTEASCGARAEWESLSAFEKALDEGIVQPASCIYAYAALSAGHPHVNFTPNLGTSIAALRELALQKGVPHCGNDGKTGETLVKTVLAPMFRARALKVHAWQGYNMLGNRDGAVLNDDAHRVAKLKNKDEALREILEDEDTHSHVGIDFVPSLRDWKTAWDFIHFEGFLGAQMSLQFTWSGSDSALAGPLVLDLVRLTDLAASRSEKGELDHTACFFKAPLNGGTHDFHAQHRRLVEYARKSR